MLDRWAEHFEEVLNQKSNFDKSVLNELPEWPVNHELLKEISASEISQCIKTLPSGKSAGNDGIPAEIFKYGGAHLTECLVKLFSKMRKEGKVIQEFKDATIIHLYKNTDDRACCDNHRGVSLLAVAGKILAKVFVKRLDTHTDE